MPGRTIGWIATSSSRPSTVTGRPSASWSWTAAGSMVTPRQSHTATLLPDGKVLVAGGFGADPPVLAAELYDPGSGTR